MRGTDTPPCAALGAVWPAAWIAIFMTLCSFGGNTYHPLSRQNTCLSTKSPRIVRRLTNDGDVLVALSLLGRKLDGSETLPERVSQVPKYRSDRAGTHPVAIISGMRMETPART